jgi:hypothetical protein
LRSLVEAALRSYAVASELHGVRIPEVEALTGWVMAQSRCRAGSDGECHWHGCPQVLSRQRSCPLWTVAGP